MFFSARPRMAIAVLDSLGDAVFVFSDRSTPEYVNEAARALISEAAAELFLPPLQQEAIAWRNLTLGTQGADLLSHGIEEECQLIERADGRRERLFRTFRLVSGMPTAFVCVTLSTYAAPQILAAERDKARADLEQSRKASLNIMEDLVRRKDQLESANHALNEEIAVRKRTEEARDRVAAIVESSEDAIYSCSLQGVVTSWNRAAERLYDYTVREILGRDSSCLVPDSERAALRDLQQKVAHGERVVALESRRITRSGAALDVSMTWSPLFDLRNRLIGYSVISRDISQRIATERELKNYREQLERLVVERTRELAASQEKARQAERLASIGALAAGIAHEINNPIGAMMLAAQNALEYKQSMTTVSELSEALDRLGQKVVSNAERCGIIVRGVLQFARKQSTEKWPSDINEIVRTSLQLVRESMNLEHATLQSDFDPELPLLRINPVEIEQVVVNLLRNACQSRDKDLLVKVCTKRMPSAARIIIEDNGRGIPEDQRAHIFDPFFTTRLERGGTGLGLSIVHGIVTSYGGSIEVQSALGKGTTISVDLPFETRRERPSERHGEKSSATLSGSN